MGTFGAGKSTIYQKYHANIPLIDIDEITFELGHGVYDKMNVSQAIHKSFMMTYDFIKRRKSFVKMGTGSSYKGLSRMIKTAKENGFYIELVYIDINPTVAFKRVQARAQQIGRGFDITLDAIIKTRNASLENYKILISIEGLIDKHQIITST